MTAAVLSRIGNGRLPAAFRRPPVLLVLIVAWSTVQFWILGPYSLLLVGDEGGSGLNSLLPLDSLVGLDGLWFPFSVTGTDLLAMGSVPPLHRAVFVLLPDWFAYASLHVVQVACGVFGSYLVVRRQTALPVGAALFAALCFGVAVSNTRLFAWTYVAIPLLIAVLDWLLEDLRSSRRWLGTLAVLLVYGWMANFALLLVFPPLFVLLWFLVMDRQVSLARLSVVAGAFVFVYLLRVPDLVAMWLHAPISKLQATTGPSVTEALYSGISHAVGSFSLSSLLPLNPTNENRFLGVPAYMMLGALLWPGRRPEGMRRYAVLVAATVVAAAVVAGGGTLLTSVLPILRGFNMARFLSPGWELVLALGGAFGFARLASWSGAGQGVWRSRTPALVVGAVVLMVTGQKAGFSAKEWISQGNFVQNYDSPVLERLADRVARSGPARIGSFQMYDGYPHAYGLETIGGRLDLYSRRFHDYWRKMSAGALTRATRSRHVLEDAPMMLGVPEAEPAADGTFTLAEFQDLDMLALANVRYVVSRDPLADPRLRRLDLGLGSDAEPWSRMSRREKILTSLRANFRGRTHLYVYELKDALPRIYLAGSLEALPSREAVYDAVAKAPVSDLRDRVRVAVADIPEGVPGQRRYDSSGSVTLLSYGSDRIVAEVTTEAPGLLVVSNGYSPYWTCDIDGVSAPVLPAYGTFWAVEVPPGKHRVRFTYQPPYAVFRGGDKP